MPDTTAIFFFTSSGEGIRTAVQYCTVPGYLGTAVLAPVN
eukprot:SAG31_NODE_950_length_10811_cov_4.497760_6_plen_40_part_00